MNWTKEKPKFNSKSKGCILLAAVSVQGEWNYSIFTIRKTSFEENWYWGIFDTWNDEWGDYEELHADLYLTLPLIEDGAC